MPTTSTATHPDARSKRLIDAVLAARWRVNFDGRLWPVRVFLAGDRLGHHVLTETTLVLFDDDSQPAHRFPIAEAEAIAGLTSAGPAPRSGARPTVSA